LQPNSVVEKNLIHTNNKKSNTKKLTKMKKMNYEAPKAEMIEMQMPVVLAETVPGNSGQDPTVGPGTGPGNDPFAS
jgi:hypothetical protein